MEPTSEHGRTYRDLSPLEQIVALVEHGEPTMLEESLAEIRRVAVAALRDDHEQSGNG